jgi:hypothetical protein
MRAALGVPAPDDVVAELAFQIACERGYMM